MRARQDRLLVAASQGISTQVAYEDVLDEAASIRLDKVRQYGEDRYEDNDEFFVRVMCYSDVYRKYIRLRKTSCKVNVTPSELFQLREDYMDLLNYAAMGVQEMDRLIRMQEEAVR